MKKITLFIFLCLNIISGASFADGSADSSQAVLRVADEGSDTLNKLNSVKLQQLFQNGKSFLEIDLDFDGWEASLPGTKYGSEALPPIKEKIMASYVGHYTSDISGNKVVKFSGKARDGRSVSAEVVCWSGSTLGAILRSTWPTAPGTSPIAIVHLVQSAGNCDWGLWATF